MNSVCSVEQSACVLRFETVIDLGGKLLGLNEVLLLMQRLGRMKDTLPQHKWQQSKGNFELARTKPTNVMYDQVTGNNRYSESVHEMQFALRKLTLR